MIVNNSNRVLNDPGAHEYFDRAKNRLVFFHSPEKTAMSAFRLRFRVPLGVKPAMGRFLSPNRSLSPKAK